MCGAILGQGGNPALQRRCGRGFGRAAASREFCGRGQRWVPAAAAGRGGPQPLAELPSARRARRPRPLMQSQPGGSSSSPGRPRSRAALYPPPELSSVPPRAPGSSITPACQHDQGKRSGFPAQIHPCILRRCGAAKGILLGKLVARRFVLRDFSADLSCFAKGISVPGGFVVWDSGADCVWFYIFPCSFVVDSMWGREVILWKRNNEEGWRRGKGRCMFSSGVNFLFMELWMIFKNLTKLTKNQQTKSRQRLWSPGRQQAFLFLWGFLSSYVCPCTKIDYG